MAAITRWSPFNEISRLHEDMERMFGQLMAPIVGQRDPLSTVWAPSVDVFSRDGSLVVEAELPGMKKKDVDITVEDNVLTLRGKLEHEEEKQEQGYFRRERRSGEFLRSIPLPISVKADEASATFENGVLCVTIPQAEEQPRGKKIVVK